MRPLTGLITGYVFKLLRESVHLSQVELAARLGIDATTLQGWESGRRPFTAVHVGRAVAIRHQLQRLGVDPALPSLLDDAAEADYLLDRIIAAGSGEVSPSEHPLGYLVLTHRLADLLSWAVTGALPAVFAARPVTSSRRGPVAPGPVLDASERVAFFAGLQTAAEQAAGNPEAVLLHRQACYLAGMDGSLSTWLGGLVVESDYFMKSRPWTPAWADARSVATGLARQGDPEPLRAFIRHSDESADLAGLNYSAYWVGEFQRKETRDDFMTDSTKTWRGADLLTHIVERLAPEHGFLDLNIHTLWSLLLSRRGVVHDDPAVSRLLYRRGCDLLDQADVISDQSRQELSNILYGLRADGVRA